jgi:hypothetical protein
MMRRGPWKKVWRPETGFPPGTSAAELGECAERIVRVLAGRGVVPLKVPEGGGGAFEGARMRPDGASSL